MENEGIIYNGTTTGPTNGVWSAEDGGSLQIYRVGSMGDRRLCMVFDLDYTLIVPKSGGIYPIDNQDWRFTSPTITAKLRQVAETHGIVIISNVCTYEDGFRQKIQDIVANIGACPIMVILSTRRDQNCKPNTGMLRFVPWVPTAYVGDCAGRRGDFSDSDLRFAIYANIPFYTPEQFFGILNYPLPRLLPNIYSMYQKRRGNNQGCCRF